ncbi:helix-turn-helix transcriptional regulator [Brevibacillus porteri]|uniref:AraC family transcriptional regulator n=1 Tax=Brevibacillus porteri TaxID=2126350 RepID=A0ABX5FMF9_9BACL|nr:AraC family transcriptional regulator [Brevibacillus porteri]MED1802716.1 AraC family transcriptional regulator [Brevibacillus porteri]MED2131682.1 AraC family transcriptional regulator [Brevibacillus porteri]MED2746082.1 AraC family transcriptional regulator [Brevibacillus porteri]MED2817165.1 AraC family transcriptional regulator [Brevibacillus porteri]MED2892289.1 AraC family transcriptional regulator [Brevibacillus porteri]
MDQATVHSIYDSYINALPSTKSDRIVSEANRYTLTNNDGYFRRVIPRPGLELVESSYSLQENRVMDLQSQAAMVELSFCLEGSGEFVVSGSQHEFLPGSCSLQLMNDFHAHFMYRADVPHRSVGIGISVEQFNEWVAESDEGAAYSFQGLLGNQAYRLFRMPLQPNMARMLQQLNDFSSSHLKLRRLHTEGKILEIVSTALDTFLFEREENRPRSQLSRSDREKIHNARDILLENMESPPSLIELARMAQLNEYKLKIGFKEEFGTSVFAYLRERRLEKALGLLLEGNLNVSEVALIVGFSNFSHFSEAFRKQYGCNPSEVKRGRFG